MTPRPSKPQTFDELVEALRDLTTKWRAMGAVGWAEDLAALLPPLPEPIKVPWWEALRDQRVSVELGWPITSAGYDGDGVTPYVFCGRGGKRVSIDANGCVEVAPAPSDTEQEPEHPCGCGEPIPGHDPESDEPRVCDDCRAYIRGEAPAPSPEVPEGPQHFSATTCASAEQVEAGWYCDAEAVGVAGDAGVCSAENPMHGPNCGLLPPLPTPSEPVECSDPEALAAAVAAGQVVEYWSEALGGWRRTGVTTAGRFLELDHYRYRIWPSGSTPGGAA